MHAVREFKTKTEWHSFGSGGELNFFLATTCSESVASLVKGLNLSKGICRVKNVVVLKSEASESEPKLF